MAAGGNIAWLSFVSVLVGTALVIGAGCVINNYYDRDIDAKMARTKKRPLVTGAIHPRDALIFAAVLAVLGFTVLVLGTNTPTVIIGLIGFLDYVLIYTWSKRHTTYATLIGSISGATPIAAGYTAAAGAFDAGALLLFAVMVIWQMPHFYAIAMFRQDDYAAAHIPVLPIARGVRRAKIHMLFYIAAYIAAVAALTVAGVTGFVFAVVMVGLSAWWLWRSIQGFNAPDTKRWARKLFGFSLYVLLGLSVMLSLNSLLP